MHLRWETKKWILSHRNQSLIHLWGVADDEVRAAVEIHYLLVEVGLHGRGLLLVLLLVLLGHDEVGHEEGLWLIPRYRNGLVYLLNIY